MNGPTICRFGAGRARRTSKPPRSRARGTISVSIAWAPTSFGQPGSSDGIQLIGVLRDQVRYGAARAVIRTLHHPAAPRARSTNSRLAISACTGDDATFLLEA